MKHKYKTNVELEKINKKLLATTIVGWSLNFLLVLFLILASIFGKKAQSVSAESYSPNNKYYYHLNYESWTPSGGYYDIPSSTLEYVMEDNGIDTSRQPSGTSVLQYKYLTYDLPIGTQVKVSSDNYINVNYIRYTFYTLRDGDNDVYWSLNNVKLASDESFNTTYDVISKHTLVAGDYDYAVYTYKDIYSTEEFYSINGNKYLYTITTLSSFVFNKAFNYNAPLGTTIDGLYGDTSWDSSGQNMRYKTYNVGYFLSNGQVYNQLKYWGIQSDGNTIYGMNSTASGQGLMSAPSGYWLYSMLYYVNTDTNTEVLVNARDLVPYNSSSGASLYYANSSTWQVDEYRYLYFLDDLSDANKLVLEKFNNNNQFAYSGTVASGDVNNVFTLVGSAFASWLPILGLSILPNITLGMLLFIPLVGMLVFAIIRIIKK